MQVEAAREPKVEAEALHDTLQVLLGRQQCLATPRKTTVKTKGHTCMHIYNNMYMTDKFHSSLIQPRFTHNAD